MDLPMDQKELVTGNSKIIAASLYLQMKKPGGSIFTGIGITHAKGKIYYVPGCRRLSGYKYVEIYYETMEKVPGAGMLYQIQIGSDRKQ